MREEEIERQELPADPGEIDEPLPPPSDGEESQLVGPEEVERETPPPVAAPEEEMGPGVERE